MLLPKAHYDILGGRHQLILRDDTITVKVIYTDQTPKLEMVTAAGVMIDTMMQLAETLQSAQPTEVTIETEA